MGSNPPWFRFYHEALDDPKVQKLSADTFRVWVNMLCLAARNGGFIPPISDVSFAFRVTSEIADEYVSNLVNVGLLDRFRNGSVRPHNWDSRQFKSDSSTERVKRFRKRSKTVPVTVDETDQSRAEQSRVIHPIVPLLELGEFKCARMTQEQHGKLASKLGGNLEAYIERFDRWVHELPEAKASGAKRKDRHAYESILAWFDRDVKDGKVKPSNLKNGKKVWQAHEYL
jgi:hypothetical protein